MKNKYFFCYTKELKDHLKSAGFDFITCAKAISNNKVFWLFERSDKLIEEYYKHKELINKK